MLIRSSPVLSAGRTPHGVIDGLRRVESAPSQEPTYEITVAHNESELRRHFDAWDDLAGNLAEPNAYYERWALIPALRHLDDARDVRVLLVYRTGGPGRPDPLLCGLVPVRRRPLSRWLPIRVLEPWQHLYCFFGIPLLRRGHAHEALEAMFVWARQDPQGAAAIRFAQVSGDGAFAKALAEVCRRDDRPTYLIEEHSRAVLAPGQDAESYLRESLSGRQYKAYRRRERSLSERGHLERRLLTRGDEIGAWAEMFLRLEGEGWKGRAGTAMRCVPADAAFFRELSQQAFTAGKLMMLGLFLDGEPLALQCNLRSGAGSFAFKTAYDEDHAESSPGWLLELHNIAYLHSARVVEWMDSCAAHDNAINRIWKERRLITNRWISTGRPPGDLLVALMPLGRWLRRRLRRTATSDGPA